MSKWDAMTPEQQRAIGEAAIAMSESNPAPPEQWSPAASLVIEAVRSADFPTWRQDRYDVVCSDGRKVCMYRHANATHETALRAAAGACDALNAHERKTRGLK